MVRAARGIVSMQKDSPNTGRPSRSFGGTVRSGTAEQGSPAEEKGTWPLCEPRTEGNREPERRNRTPKRGPARKGGSKCTEQMCEKSRIGRRLVPSVSPNKAEKGCEARRGSAIAGKGENRSLYPAVRPVAVSCASARTHKEWSRTVRDEK